MDVIYATITLLLKFQYNIEREREEEEEKEIPGRKRRIPMVRNP